MGGRRTAARRRSVAGKHFRGDARVKDDSAVTDDDIAKHNLVLWGDPSSNAVLKKILAKLPLEWDAETLTVGKSTGSRPRTSRC